MPYKKELAKRRKLTPVAIAYLSDDKTEIQENSHDDYALWSFQHGFETPFEDHKPEELWQQYRDDFLPKFIEKNPGKRPWPWWQFDAPRWNDPFEEAYFHGTLPEPRQRIGGTGTPDYGVLAYVPHFAKGIPTGWVSKFDEEYYNGRAKDIHGNIIPTNYKEGDFKGVAIDPDDPPIFESETSYLLRHDLLSPQEKKYVAGHPELLEPEILKFTEDEKNEI